MERDFLFREITSLTGLAVQPAEYEVGRSLPTAHAEGYGFYWQFKNANILHRNGKSAGGRTCNITCIGMILEAFGIGKEKTRPDINKEVLYRLANLYSKELENRSLYDLRYPDFLQLLAIYLRLRNKSAPGKDEIEQARQEAAGLVTSWGFMDNLTESFIGLAFESKSIFGSTINKGLKTLGEKTRYKKPIAPGEADQVIPLSLYKTKALSAMNQEVKNGYKIIVHEFNHFTVLMEANEKEVRINNPEHRLGGNMAVSWETARNKGMFSGYMRCRADGYVPQQVFAGNISQPAPVNGDMNDAILKNRRFSKQLGWDRYIFEINDLLLPFSGYSNVSLGEEAFARAAAKWQAKNGFTGRDVDGVIGPATWRKMSAQLKITSNNSGGASDMDKVLARINQYNELIEAAGKKYNLPPEVIRAVIAIESGGNPRTTSSGGYKGLMQAGVNDDQYDPKTSIETGAKKFAEFKNSYIIPRLKDFGVDAGQIDRKTLSSLIIASYNAGPVTVLKALEYAHKSGDWRKWLDAENYQRALVFSGGYHTYDGCIKNEAPAAIAEAKRQRTSYSNWRVTKQNWRNFADPPVLSELERSASKIMMCWVRTKHKYTYPYIAKFLQYI